MTDLFENGIICQLPDAFKERFYFAVLCFARISLDLIQNKHLDLVHKLVQNKIAAGEMFRFHSVSALLL